MKALTKELAIRDTLLEQEKVSYASDEIFLPEGGIDCNEGCNPYGFPDSLQEAMKNFDIKKFGPYPHCHEPIDNLAEYWKEFADVEPENILLADGSINALYIIFGIFKNKGTVALGVSPQFTDAEMAMKLLGMTYKSYKLKKENDFRFNTDEFIALMTDDVRIVYIDNPNNPTGQMVPIADIERILDRAIEIGAAVIIDEAYGDLMPKYNSAMTLVTRYPNLINVKTMSKAFGLAGLRVGYVIASKTLIGYMKKTVNPYQVSEFAREMAGVALKDKEHVEKSNEAFAKMKHEIKEVLKTPGHLRMSASYDTCSIFLLIHDNPSVDLQKLFWDNKVLCVSGYSFNGLDKDSVRMRLPRLEEFPVLLEAIKTIHNA